MKKYLVLFLFPTFLYSQQRYLVTPNDEFIPMRGGESFANAVHRAKEESSKQSACGTKFIFGYVSSHLYESFGAKHKDVMAQWYVAKASGTIDSIFIEDPGPVGNYDSSVSIRIFRSNIQPGIGPGFGPYRAPCAPWGYYVCTNDLDRGISPFKDEATDSTWNSTAMEDSGSFDPLGELIWGHGGVTVKMIDYLWTNWLTVSTTEFGESLRVKAGDAFFITMKVRSLNAHPTGLENFTYFGGEQFHVSPGVDELYPSRFWKFYEHDSATSTCRGVAVSDAPKGWYARGGYSQDSADVAYLELYYQLTVTENVGPNIQSASVLHSTLESTPRVINADIMDCDPQDPSRAGVKLSSIRWSLDGIDQPQLPMNVVGGLTWMGMIPGEPPGSVITYRVYAEDSTGLSHTTAPTTYTIIQPSSPFAKVVVSHGCASKSIAGSASNVISPSDFYLPPGVPPGWSPLNDGTAGPFDLGSNMPLFGDVGRYLWLGVNGGVAISKNNTDTVDINAVGTFDPSWQFPYPGSVRRGGRSDPSGSTRMPGNFFAPLWADLWYGDSAGGTVCGHIRFQRGYAGDTCVVIAEWDSIGAYSLVGGPQCDELTFRAIFNKCDGTIEYQYDNVGTLGQDTTSIVGFEADSTLLTIPSHFSCGGKRPSMFITDHGYPLERRPSAGMCIKIYQGIIVSTTAGWNLISIGVIPPDSVFSKKVLFPDAISHAFFYRGVYDWYDTLVPGRGYWIKFPPGSCVGVAGKLLHDVVDSIRPGWNLVGTIAFPVATSSITQGGGVVLTSAFYDYNGTYHTTSTLKPGRGFWVKASAPGTLTINGGVPSAEPKNAPSPNFASLNSITITDNAGRYQTLYLGEESSIKEPLSFYELPPAALEFDARYSSEGMVETYPARLDEKAVYEYPVNISTEAYPITISWNTQNAPERKIVLTSTDGKLGKTVLDGSGKLKISDENVKGIVVILADVDLPIEYALAQNYPNPFNPTTEIRFTIRDAGFVSLKMFDVLGREVSILVNEERESGEYSITWDATNFASGMYFYELISGSFRDVKKMVLVR